jgi:inositol phosphorylceramide mannosyltransferase catalytic subunit
MRRPLLLLILIVAAIVVWATYLVSTLIGLLFENGLAHAITPESLSVRIHWTEDRRPIPKILHQTWKNETVPEAWSIAQYSCVDLHPDYQYIVPLRHPQSSTNCYSYGRMHRVGNLLKRNTLGS